MTRKRIRYSELASPPSAPAQPSPVPALESAAVPPEPIAPATDDEDVVAPIVQASADEPLVVERDDDAPLISTIVDRPLPVALSAPSIEPQVRDAAQAGNDAPTSEVPKPSRPRRNSTPVELARTLTAERRAARAQEGESVDESDEWSESSTIEPADEPQRSLRERARSRSGRAELLMFHVGGERFAVELILVDEVIDLPVIHHVPEMPPAMLGVVTVRGSLTPVYSPQHALGLPLVLREALLIFRRGAQRVGILIDDVDDALPVDMSELADKPGGEEGNTVLLGVIRLANSLVGIIDADALIVSCQSANILEPA